MRLMIFGLTTLETRFLRVGLIEMFKILRGFENLDPDRFFQVIGDGARRGHSFKLFEKRYRWTWGSSSLLAGFVRSGPWNRLGNGIYCFCLQGQ